MSLNGGLVRKKKFLFLEPPPPLPEGACRRRPERWSGAGGAALGRVTVNRNNTRKRTTGGILLTLGGRWKETPSDGRRILPTKVRGHAYCNRTHGIRYKHGCAERVRGRTVTTKYHNAVIIVIINTTVTQNREYASEHFGGRSNEWEISRNSCSPGATGRNGSPSSVYHRRDRNICHAPDVDGARDNLGQKKPRESREEREQLPAAAARTARTTIMTYEAVCCLPYTIIIYHTYKYIYI